MKREFFGMQFVSNGPEIPDELISAQEQGRTLFVCGAGVSSPAGLPLFGGLVQGIYEELGEDWRLHPAERAGMEDGGEIYAQYDRVLRCLERRLAASHAPRHRGMRERIRAAVRKRLAPRPGADLSNHLALIDLSRDAEGRNRILTTNFDTLFERAWHEQHGRLIASHAGAAMPQPMTQAFAGVLHLHGRLADPLPELQLSETDLVLTSAEFGDAYLRSAWASRYIYDLVRAYTLVLVGYQANDPPMRYLLEALEADRERYPDLKKVYAFAPCEAGKEEHEKALWEAKAVEPIVYLAMGADHSVLYGSLLEWRRYANDPTDWRRKRLITLFSRSPSSLPVTNVEECANLLSHGDASQLLRQVSPNADWLSALASKRVFERDAADPGSWIATRIHDPEMIRACAALPSLSEQACWQIARAIDSQRSTLPAVRLEAWQLLLSLKRAETRPDSHYLWLDIVRDIKNGNAGFEARRMICDNLRPRLKIMKPWRSYEPSTAEDDGEALYELLRLDFEAADYPSVEDVLAAWPQTEEHEARLFRSANRALAEALEQAEDVGFTG